MANSGWGAGLTGMSQGLFGMADLLRQRKLDEQQEQERQRQQAERLAESKRQEAELKLRQDAAQQQTARQDSADARFDADQFDTNDPLSADMVSRLQRTGNSGMIRTVGAGQTALPSTRWQGDKFTEVRDPGAVEGMFRRPNRADRQREDVQAEARTARQDTARDRAATFASTQAFQGDQRERDREARRVSDDARLEQSGMLRSISAGIQQQNADTNRGRLEDQRKATQEKTDLRIKETNRGVENTVSDIDSIKNMVTNLIGDPKTGAKRHPGFDDIFGVWDAATIQLDPDTLDAQSRLDQLRSVLTVDTILKMKRESPNGATGFGSLQKNEFDTLVNAAARFQKQRINEADAEAALLEVQTLLEKASEREKKRLIRTGPIRVDINGNPIR